jgi:negative regulator of replication initiation
MQMKMIEIDQEIFDFLKAKAEPFVDTPNDVLRRLLIDKQVKTNIMPDTQFKASANTPPPVPAGTPKALEHTLQVIYLSHFQKYSRSKATKMVAEIHDVASQTVLDKYCRQLNLTASEFDKLLSEDGIKTLKIKLQNKFHDHVDVIDNYLTI